MSESISRRSFLKTAAAGVVGASVVASGFSLVGCSSGGGADSGVSGTASATAMGKGGDVTVTVTVENGSITEVAVDGPNETPTIGGIAIEELPQAIIDAQSFDVDGVAGATLTSDAIKTAGQEAYDSIMNGEAE